MSVHGLTNGFDPVHIRLVDFPSGHLWEKTRITWTRRTPLLPKRRENTYRDEAVDDWTLGRRTAVVTYYGDRFVRFFDRDGWGEWEDIA